MRRCAVIGGGLGGLTAAMLLAHKGFSVDLFEQREKTGGKAVSRVRGPFRFDMGPTLLTMPFVLDRVFKESGRNLKNYIDILPLTETTRYFFPDGAIFKAYADRRAFYEEASRVFSDPLQRVSDYFSYCKTIYDLTADIFLFSSFHEIRMLIENHKWERLPEMYKMDPFRTMHRVHSRFFKDKRLVQFLDRYATFNGSSPYKVPATLSIISHVEHMGAFVPKGGIGQIPEALEKAALEEGVRIHRGVKVDGIDFGGGRVKGIVCGKESYAFDFVVSNADVYSTYHDLLKAPGMLPAIKYRLLEPSSSALVFYWPMKISAPVLSAHNIIFSSDYKAEFRELFHKKISPKDPTVYIYISSRFNLSDAPLGHENWYVMINAPSINGQDWKVETERVKKIVKEKILKRFGIDVDKALVCEEPDRETLNPEDIRNLTSSRLGSLYGISSNNMMAAFLRQRNRSGQIKGLYFCGGSASPGGGIPLAILSGSMVAKLAEIHEG